MSKMSLQTKEVRAVLAAAEYEALLRLSESRSRNFAETIRELIRTASARAWEDAAAPRLRTLDERTRSIEEQLAHLAKRQEDTIAILRSVEQVLLGRLDEQAQLFDALVRMTTLTTFRMQAVIEHHPKPEVQQRFLQLMREAGL
jgi:hypothetical protein